MVGPNDEADKVTPRIEFIDPVVPFRLTVYISNEFPREKAVEFARLVSDLYQRIKDRP